MFAAAPAWIGMSHGQEVVYVLLDFCARTLGKNSPGSCGKQRGAFGWVTRCNRGALVLRHVEERVRRHLSFPGGRIIWQRLECVDSLGILRPFAIHVSRET